MKLLYGRAGRLTAENGGFRPGQYEITGNVTFMDRLEQLAFNALPAALWPDVTANVYHHRSNQLSCGGQYGYNLFYCCTSNVHQGWPYFVLGQVH